MAKASLLFVERENQLQEAKVKMESEALKAAREVVIKEAAVRIFEEYVSSSERGSDIYVDRTPADPVQCTREYVAGLTIHNHSQPVQTPAMPPATPQPIQMPALPSGQNRDRTPPFTYMQVLSQIHRITIKGIAAWNIPLTTRDN